MSKKPFSREPETPLPSPTCEQLDARWQELSGAVKVEPLQTILHTCLVSGAADYQQLQNATGLTRDRLNRVMDILSTPTRHLSAVLRLHPRPLGHPGERGRTRRVYLLGEVGAALLRQVYQIETEPCGLKEDDAIQHALAMLNLHQCARAAGLAIQTDKTIPYADHHNLRPDHQITLTDGSCALFEIEQSASPETLRRVLNSLQHKQAFFESETGKQFSPEVRMLLNLPVGKTLERTLRLWEQAFALLTEKVGGQAAFRLRVMPLGDFISDPDWLCTGAGWREILPTRPANAIQPVEKEKSSQTKTSVPKALMYRTTHDDRLVLGALWQTFLESAELHREEIRLPDPEFLHLVRLIYVASHDDARPILAQAGVPHASIYLFRQYLVMHPRLLENLRSQIYAGRSTMRWNPTTIKHRMQVVFNTFLGYHGWRSNGPLSVYATLSDWYSNETRTFDVNVRIRNPELLMDKTDLVVPTQSEVRQVEQALSWVLTAIFEHSQELQIGRVDFW